MAEELDIQRNIGKRLISAPHRRRHTLIACRQESGHTDDTP